MHACYYTNTITQLCNYEGSNNLVLITVNSLHPPEACKVHLYN